MEPALYLQRRTGRDLRQVSLAHVCLWLEGRMARRKDRSLRVAPWTRPRWRIECPQCGVPVWVYHERQPLGGNEVLGAALHRLRINEGHGKGALGFVGVRYCPGKLLDRRCLLSDGLFYEDQDREPDGTPRLYPCSPSESGSAPGTGDRVSKKA